LAFNINKSTLINVAIALFGLYVHVINKHKKIYNQISIIIMPLAVAARCFLFRLFEFTKELLKATCLRYANVDIRTLIRRQALGVDADKNSANRVAYLFLIKI